MDVRLYKPDDETAVKEFAKKHNLEFNLNASIVIIAEDDNKNIIGLSSIRSVAFIEPFISENPLTSFKLYATTIKLLEKLEQPIVRCFTTPEHKELFEKVGFEQVFCDSIILEKKITGV